LKIKDFFFTLLLVLIRRVIKREKEKKGWVGGIASAPAGLDISSPHHPFTPEYYINIYGGARRQLRRRSRPYFICGYSGCKEKIPSTTYVRIKKEEEDGIIKSRHWQEPLPTHTHTA